jgi:hypothetical protein
MDDFRHSADAAYAAVDVPDSVIDILSELRCYLQVRVGLGSRLGLVRDRPHGIVMVVCLLAASSDVEHAALSACIVHSTSQKQKVAALTARYCCML